MFKNANAAALLLIYGLCLPLAIFAGYLLANPTSFTSFSALSLIALLLLVPLFLKWHHTLLILAWNSTLIIFFLPGQPNLGVVVAVGSLGMVILNRIMDKKKQSIQVPALAAPLIFLGLVVAVTILFTGGIGARVLGSEMFGGKKYVMVFGAIIGYFALTAQKIPVERGVLIASLFFLAGATAVFSDLIYMAGPSFYFLFALFSSNLTAMQVVTQETLLRYSGLALGGMSVCFYLLMRYQVSGVFDLTKPWRIIILALAFSVSLLGGFRSTAIILSLIIFFQFYFEGGFKTKLFPVLVLVGIFLAVIVFVFVETFPLSIQRSLSFLPVEVHPMARQDAISTLDWRVQIWKTVWPEVPRYILMGKGYSFSGMDLYLMEEAIKRGMYTAYEDTLISGNYHNGPLTIIIPFGIFGVIGFFWFALASLRLLHANYRFGRPELKSVNTFLLAYFAARLVFFLFLYGQLELDLMLFTGTVGLSIALNGGMRSNEDLAAEQVQEPMEETSIESVAGKPGLAPVGAA